MIMELTKEYLKTWYTENKWSMAMIAHDNDVSITTVLYWMKKSGIPRRAQKRSVMTRRYLKKRYIKDGWSLKMIAAEKGVSHPTVLYWLVKYGIPRRQSGNPNERRKPGGGLAKEHLEKRYLENLWTLDMIAAELHTSAGSVWLAMKDYGIPRRKSGFQPAFNITKEYLERRYVKDGLSETMIANELNVGRGSIHYRLKKFGIHE